jgi:transposase-like protein
MHGNSKYTPEIAESIASMFAQNISIKLIANDIGVSPGTIYKWMYENQSFGDLIARARMPQAEVIREKIAETGEKVLTGDIDPNAANVALKTMQWLASKANPKVYGDRQILAGDAENPLQMLAVRLDQAIAKSEALEQSEFKMIDVTPRQSATDIADLF